MNHNSSKSNNPLQGVNCCASNCHYWGNGDHCHATSIQVTPPEASGSQDTDCETFLPKH
ncbi:MAG: DUF1540 domain-containing protein [Peptococcaceae bacterium]|jgi:hypothetical protein|nr:DUF1540 domain-containing protein [Peptococcaceae bacterium]